VRFELGPHYPYVGPTPVMLDIPPVFHPNVFTDGRVCTGPGLWTPDEGLAFVVLRVAKMLLYFDGVTNPSNPANPAAAAWYRENRSRFPLDRFATFPDPITGASSERPRLIIRRKGLP
jgi:ubiquitin-protein ligase